MDRNDKIITFVLLTFSALVSLLALPESITHIDAESQVQAETVQSAFKDIQLEAKSAYVYDLTNNRELFSQNASQSFPLASLTKIMTAITATELTSKNESTTVTIDTDSLQESGDNGLYADERWDLTKILQFMLVVSSNDAASAIARSIGEQLPGGIGNGRALFIQAMNAKAQELSLNTLHFNNPSGLDETDTEAGAYGSADDVAHLLAYAARVDRHIIEPTRYAQFDTTSLDGVRHIVPNTDTIIHQIPSLIAGKTGFTNLAGGNLAIIFDAGIQHPIAIVVLGSSYDGRFNDMKKLIDASMKTLNP